MRVLFDPRFGEHDPGRGHPERPSRIEACLSALTDAGTVAEECEYEATLQELSAVHDAAYVTALREACRDGGGWISRDTFAGPRSFTIAARAAGMASKAVEISFDQSSACFCLGRPPGHHSGPDYAMGFCLLNSAAVATARALALGAARVMVIDIDVHHGNGTQEIFYIDPRVLYLSIHQANWYPRTGYLEEIGAGTGKGTTVNIPLAAGAGDASYFAAMDVIARPIALKFEPELIVVSAGFDAHRDDPLGAMQLSEAGFFWIGSRLKSLAREVAGGKAVFVLEGGYASRALASSFVAVASPGTLRTPPEATPNHTPEGRRAAAFHAGRWGLAPEIGNERR